MATTGIAERIAYGRPVDYDREVEEPVHLVPRATAVLVARVLMATIFIIGGINKLTHLNETAGYMTQMGIPSAHALGVIAGLAELLGGVAILTGFLARLGALGLFIYLIPTTLIFHAFWNVADPMQHQMQVVNFMKNLAVMGGLLLLYAHGPSRYSIDQRMRRPLSP